MSYRTILCAYKDMEEDEWRSFVETHDINSSDDELKKAARAATEENLVISCIFGIEDPLRDGIPDTIRNLARAGVTVRMCTGDNPETARSICLKAGILNDPKDD